MGETSKETMCIFAIPDADAKEGFTTTLIQPRHKWLMNDEDINLGEVDVYYDIPSSLDRNELIGKAITTMKEKQARYRAEAEEKCTRLQEKINTLLMITHQSEPVDTDAVIDRSDLGDDIPF